AAGVPGRHRASLSGGTVRDFLLDALRKGPHRQGNEQKETQRGRRVPGGKGTPPLRDPLPVGGVAIGGHARPPSLSSVPPLPPTPSPRRRGGAEGSFSPSPLRGRGWGEGFRKASTSPERRRRGSSRSSPCYTAPSRGRRASRQSGRRP